MAEKSDTSPSLSQEGKDKLGASEIALTKILQKKFARVFPAQIVSDGIELPGKWKSLGKLEPLELVAQAGWLNIVWRVPVTEKVARSR